MMNRFFGVLFDLGSTLIYFNGDWAEVFAGADQAVYSVLLEAGFAPEDSNFPAKFRGRLREYHAAREVDMIEHTTVKILVDLLAEEGYREVPQEVIDLAMARMYAVSQAHWHVESDTVETLKQLQASGYRLGVISNAANQQDVNTLVDNAKIGPYLDFVITSAESGMRTPAPSIFRQGLDRWGVSPDEVVMVGDLLRPDILGAQQLGIYSVWITRRAGSAENKKYAGTITPDAQIEALSELPDLMGKLESEGG
jgi:HAD superfamily hydrolase (TIGR01549 family)